MESKTSEEYLDRELDPEVAARRNTLFNKYIPPYFRLIRYLVKRYSVSPDDWDENYSLALTNLFRGIETYNPEVDIRTWIHICTKRYIFEQEKRKQRINSHLNHDQDVGDVVNLGVASSDPEWVSASVMNEFNYREFYSDEVLEAIDSLDPMHKEALILQEAGYTLKEIAAIEHRKGRLESCNINTIKSRLFLARRILMNKLNRNGTRKSSQES